MFQIKFLVKVISPRNYLRIFIPEHKETIFDSANLSHYRECIVIRHLRYELRIKYHQHNISLIKHLKSMERTEYRYQQCQLKRALP